jgi:hypothetical protein
MALLDDAILTKTEFSSQLFRNPNLVSLAVVASNPDVANERGDYIIEAGVLDLDVQERAKRTLAADEQQFDRVVPARLPIPGRARAANTESDYVRISIVQRDKVEALSYTDTRRPAEGGNSVGVLGLGGSGTLGARVTANGQEGFFISNWHVLHAGVGTNGSPILQRAPGDGGANPRDRIGTLYWWALNEYADAAIGKADRVTDLSYQMRCGYRIGGFKPAQVGMDVKKCGRTSELTQARITSVSADVQVGGYPTGTRLFRDQVETTFLLSPGDSGSVLCTLNNDLVALGFAGGSQRSYANKFSRVTSIIESGKCVDEDGSEVSSPIASVAFS